MKNELAKRTAGVQIANMDDLARVADMMARSGFFTDARDAAQAGVKIMAGQAWGIDPFNAMTGIHIIKNRPTISAGLMASAVKGHARYDYRVRRRDNDGCVIEFFEAGESLGVMEFTKEDAQRAGLLGQDNYKKHPAAMYFARAMSAGVRTFCPDVFSSSVYVPEELGASVDADGEVLDVAYQEAPQAPTAAPMEAKADATPAAPQTPPRDPQEFPEDPPAEVLEPGITKEQVTLMGRAINEAQMGREDARKFVSYMVGRELTDVRGLTEAEAARLIERWQDKRTKSGFGRDKISDDVQKWVDHKAMQAEEGEAA